MGELRELVKPVAPIEPLEEVEQVNEYEGEIKKVSEIKPGDVCQRLTLKPGKEGMPRFFYTEDVEKYYGDNSKVIRCFSVKDNASKQIVCPSNMEVRVLTGQLGKKHRATYDTHTNKNMHPEIFVCDAEGKMIPAFKFLGPKEKPVKTREDQSVYFDGYQAEFTVKAQNCLAYVLDSVQLGLKQTLEEARKLDSKAKLSIQNVFEVPFEELQAEKEEFVQFGCSPSLNAYGLARPDLNGREVPYRMAGGHIHYGITGKTPEQLAEMVKSMDAILGVACVSLAAEFDNPVRRTMYGLAGEYRLPKHGLEYRVLSNFWLTHPVIANLVFDIGRKAASVGSSRLLQHWKSSEDETIEVIQTHDVIAARKILRRNKEMFKSIIKAAYPNMTEESTVNKTYKVFLNGLETLIKDPEDIEGNWNLAGQWTTHCDGSGKNWANTSGRKGKV